MSIAARQNPQVPPTHVHTNPEFSKTSNSTKQYPISFDFIPNNFFTDVVVVLQPREAWVTFQILGNSHKFDIREASTASKLKKLVKAQWIHYRGATNRDNLRNKDQVICEFVIDTLLTVYIMYQVYGLLTLNYCAWYGEQLSKLDSPNHSTLPPRCPRCHLRSH